MAPSLKFISFLFLFALSSMQIHARDSQFFSKVPATAVNNPQENTPRNKEEEILNNQGPEPAFYQDTQNGYGLYGQESTQFPTTTKLTSSPYPSTTYTPYKTQTQTQSYTTYPDSITNNNNYYHNNNAFQERQGETSTQETRYTPTYRGNNNGDMQYSGRQGMSDTRYLENGRFFYDMKGEKKYYNPNQYQNSRDNYNNAREYYRNNQNSNNEYENSMERQQNEDGWEESQEEQYVP